MRAPAGGFLGAFEPAPDRARALMDRLAGQGARAEQAGSVVAAWEELPGQGLWHGDRGAVAYDLDLTNEKELRSELEGEVGAPADPGELLWRLYARHGEGFCDRLRGAFGFCLWDGRGHRLLAATDPYGIRQVVYAAVPGGLVAASRIRHLLLHPAVETGLDPDALFAYLFFSAIPSPMTIWEQVRRLEPGHLLVWEGGKLATRAYYDIRYRTDGEAGEGYWRHAIRWQVRDAVRRYAVLSDPGSTGCFLSGGTDSSSVAGFYTRVTGVPAKTFSIGFDEPGYNELDYAHIAARHFGTDQRDYLATPGDVLGVLEGLHRVYDEPFGNSSVVPAYCCARIAREHGVDVMLAGDGGDEIFGGNERYATNLVFQRYHRVPGILRRGVFEPLLGLLPPWGPIHKAKRYVRRANIPNPDRFYSYNLLAETGPEEIFQPGFLEAVDPGCFLALARAHYARAAPAHDTDRLLYLDMKFTITDNDLRKVTQMCEAAGVRVRYPLLHRELVDFAAVIPPTLKVKPGRERYMFKRAMEGFLPREIIEKRKQGFGLPIGPWLCSDPGLRQILHDTLLAPDARILEYVRPPFLQALHQGLHQDSVAYYGGNLWVFLVLELWLRHAGRLGG